MKIWALADLHLSFGVPSKSMEVFGPSWKDYQSKMQEFWTRLVHKEDLVLVPGDISWAIHLQEILIDLDWIAALPGTKILLKGNHDYWWSSTNKLRRIIPPSIHLIYHDAFEWQNVAIGGTRLWDTPEYSYDEFIAFQPNPRCVKSKTAEELSHQKEDNARIFARELERLKCSLSQLSPKATTRIALTHYPPIGPDLQPSRTSEILEEYKIDICIFGHLHSVKQGALPLGTARGVRYLFASADYLNFEPILVLDIDAPFSK
jgi:uncharacterized protein